MRHLLGILALLLLVQHVALPLLPEGDCCDQAEDSSRCADSCPLCLCCLDRTIVLTPEFNDSAPNPLPDAVLPARAGLLLSPGPAEILHVPKLLQA